MRYFLLAGLLFAHASTGQEHFMHDSIDDIMEISNPACLINGVIRATEYNHELTYRYVDNVKIKPEWYKWGKECEQFSHNHFTDYEVPDLDRFHLNTRVTITYVKTRDNWIIQSVLPGEF